MAVINVAGERGSKIFGQRLVFLLDFAPGIFLGGVVDFEAENANGEYRYHHEAQHQQGIDRKSLANLGGRI